LQLDLKNIEHLEELVEIIRDQRYRFTPETISLAKQGAQLAKDMNNFEIQGKLYNYLGVFHAMQGLNYKAEHYFQKAHEIYVLLGDENKIATSFINLGLLNYEQKKYEQAINCFFQALKYNQSRLEPRILNNIGNTYLEINDLEKAEKHFVRGLKLSKQEEILDSTCKILINLGIIHRKREEPDKALDFLNEALIITQQNQFSTIQIDCLLELAHVYKSKHQLNKAIGIYQKVLALSNASKLYRIESLACLEIGKIFLKNGQTIKGITYGEQALELSQQYKFVDKTIDALKLIREGNVILGQIREANQLADQIIDIQQQKYADKFWGEFEEIVQDKDVEITELISKNEIISKQNDLLLLTNRELEKYAYIVAHDLKEPLRNITSFSQLLSNKVNKLHKTSNISNEIENYKNFIMENTNILQSKLDNLLVYSTLRLDINNVKHLKIKPFIIEYFISRSEFKPQELRNILDLSEAQNLYLDVDPKHLDLLMKEILENALLYAKPNVPLEISVGVKPGPNDEVWFWFKDNGVGVEVDYHKKIFDMFTRLDGKSEEHTGMGLAICQKIISLYNGKIFVESTYGEGSTFYFMLKSVVKA